MTQEFARQRRETNLLDDFRRAAQRRFDVFEHWDGLAFDEVGEEGMTPHQVVHFSAIKHDLRTTCNDLEKVTGLQRQVGTSLFHLLLMYTVRSVFRNCCAEVQAPVNGTSDAHDTKVRISKKEEEI